MWSIQRDSLLGTMRETDWSSACKVQIAQIVTMTQYKPLLHFLSDVHVYARSVPSMLSQAKSSGPRICFPPSVSSLFTSLAAS